MKIKKNGKKGVTLIEILLSLTITMILIIGVFMLYNKVVENRDLKELKDSVIEIKEVYETINFHDRNTTQGSSNRILATSMPQMFSEKIKSGIEKNKEIILPFIGSAFIYSEVKVGHITPSDKRFKWKNTPCLKIVGELKGVVSFSYRNKEIDSNKTPKEICEMWEKDASYSGFIF